MAVGRTVKAVNKAWMLINFNYTKYLLNEQEIELNELNNELYLKKLSTCCDYSCIFDAGKFKSNDSTCL